MRIKRSVKTSPRLKRTALGCALCLVYAGAQAATVANINFSEVPLGTADPLIQGVQFSAGPAALFADTITADSMSPTNPYLLSGIKDVSRYTNTSFVQAALASQGGAGFSTDISLKAGFLAAAPTGETILVEARQGGVVQGATWVTTASSDLSTLTINLGQLSFNQLYIYVPSNFGSWFRIDDLIINVTALAPLAPPPVPVCGSYLSTQVGAGKCIATGTLSFTAANQNVTGWLNVGVAGGKIDTAGWNSTVSGLIFGRGGLTKLGEGTLSLTAANTYQGDTVVQQGTLAVDGSLASKVIVNPNGTLRGTGTIRGETTVAGRLAPGNSPGTLTFEAPVSMTPGGTLQIDMDGTGVGNGPGNYSRVLVQGLGNTFTAAGTLEPRLRGITGDASNGFTPVIGQAFTIVNAQGGVIGTFDGLNQPLDGLPAGTRFDALYDPDTVRLALTPADYANLPNVSLKGNARSVGAALDSTRPAAYARKNPLFQSLALLSEPQLAVTLQQLGGEIQSDMIAAGFNLHRFTRGLVFNRLNDIRLDRTTPGMTGIAAAGTAGEIGRVAGQSAENLTAASSQSVWIQGIGGRTNTSADRQAAGYDENLWGVIGGYDRSVTPNLHLGGAIGYGHNRVDAGTFGTGNTETVQLMAYGLWRQNKLFANLALGYGWDHYDTSRTVDLHSGASSLTSSARGQSGFLDAEGGLRLNWNRWMVEPTLGVRGDILTRNGFNEQGGLGGLSVASDTYTAIQTRLGTKLSYGFDLGQERWLTPELRVYWLHDFGDAIASTSRVTLLDRTFNVTAPNAGRDALALGLGVRMTATKRLSLYLDYNYAYRSNQTGHDLLAGIQFSL